MNIRVRLGCLFGYLALMGGVAGCGAGDYQKRVDARVQQLKKESAFKDLGAPVLLGETRVTARLPKLFGDPPQPAANAARIAVPGLDQLGDKAAFGYEAMLPMGNDDAAGKASCGLRFWVRPAPSADFSGEISTWMRDKFPNASDKLQQVTLRSDRDVESSWGTAEGESKGEFFCVLGNKEELQERDGRVAVYLYKSPDGLTQILMTLRAPKILWEKHNLKKLAEQTAACVAIKPAEGS